MRVLLVLAVLAGGCATGYQPHGWRGGYSEGQLAERVFEVQFVGNAWTHQSTVEAYALRRAAEIAVARGFSGFVEMKAGTVAYQSVSYTTTFDYASGQYYREPSVSTSHATSMRIYLLTAEQMQDVPVAIDARIILSRWPSPAAREAAQQVAADRAIELERCRQTLASPDAKNYPGYSAACREKLSAAAAPTP